MSKLKVFEAFAGVGCQSMALRNLGIDFEVVGISEVDKYALIGYDAIHNYMQEQIKFPPIPQMLKEFEDKHIAYDFSTNKLEIPKSPKDIARLYQAHIRSKNYGDIRLIDPTTLPEIDLFTYSYPCKNISVAGKQAGLEEGSGTQSSLVWECFKIIEHSRPKYLLMENVKNLVGSAHKPYFDMICQRLDGIGYNNYWQVLNGVDFGVPQNRERVMMVSIRNDIDNGKFFMPLGFPLDKKLKDILEDKVDERHYVKNKPFQLVDRGRIKAEFLNVSFNQGKVIYSTEYYFQTLGARDRGTNNILVQEEVDGKLEYRVRRLTTLEWWRLMGMSDEDHERARYVGLPETKLYERAGRGIVVPMLEEIFRNLLL